MADALVATLTRVGTAAFEAEAGSGGTLVLDGTPKIGGEGKGMRPMELLVTALAGCAAMDVVSILAKQKEPLEDLTIEVEAARKDAVPAKLESAHLRFTATGDVNPKKLERAVRLSVEKYCSVKDSLDPNLPVTFETILT
ncbi:MAG: OsmC family protein [Sandaracinaceae bacterium]